MSSNKCAKCDSTVYPVEGLRCLDKMWHKGCFKCHECNMTLSLKNYKGFEKRPYCNAHCPQAKATTVADTPEIRRLAENTRIQSQAKYHEDFEKSKGKGFTTIADDPETLRIKNTSKIISNVAYHGELERKKQMENRRSSSGTEEVPHNNNNVLHPVNDQNSNRFNGQQAQLEAQKQHDALIKQQKHQLLHAQDHNIQSVNNRHSQPIDGSGRQQSQQINRSVQNQYIGLHQDQQQILMRLQAQQMAQQDQTHYTNRHSLDPSLPLGRQIQKQPNNAVNGNLQRIVKDPNGPASKQQQQPTKYMPLNEPMLHLPGAPGPRIIPPGARIVNGPPPMSSMPTQMMGPNGPMVTTSGPHPQRMYSHPHVMNTSYNHQLGHMNGMIPKQPNHAQHLMFASGPRGPIHPGHMPHTNSHPQIHLYNQQPMPQAQPTHQFSQRMIPRRTFRAIYDYVANDVDEVSFYENDILVDCVNVDANWLIGKVARSGQTGMLPANYVAELSG